MSFLAFTLHLEKAGFTSGRGLTWLLDDSVAGVGDFLPLGLVRILMVVEVTKAVYGIPVRKSSFAY